MIGKRERVRRNKKQWIAEFYSRVKACGRCRDCGGGGVVIGRHPEGRSVGDITRAFGGDHGRIKEWIRTCGWQCPSCRNRGCGVRGGETFRVNSLKGGYQPIELLQGELRGLKERERELKGAASAVRRKLAPTLHQYPWRSREKGGKKGPLTVRSCQFALEQEMNSQQPGTTPESRVETLRQQGRIDGSWWPPEELQAAFDEQADYRDRIHQVAVEILRVSEELRKAEEADPRGGRR